MQVKASCLHPLFTELLGGINTVLDEDVQSSKSIFVNRTQQCFAVKTGADSFLDVARSVFCRISGEIHELAAKYREAYALDTLKVCRAP
jgi:DNA mismatch repair protein MSH4